MQSSVNISSEVLDWVIAHAQMNSLSPQIVGYLNLVFTIILLDFSYQKPRERLNDRLRQLNFLLPLQRLFTGRVHIFLIFNFQGTNSFLSFRPAAFTADGCYARKVVTACLASVTVRKGMWSIQMELKDDRHQFAFQPLV